VFELVNSIVENCKKLEKEETFEVCSLIGVDKERGSKLIRYVEETLMLSAAREQPFVSVVAKAVKQCTNIRELLLVFITLGRLSVFLYDPMVILGLIASFRAKVEQLKENKEVV